MRTNMENIERLFLTLLMQIALSSCQNLTSPPTLLGCYQSGDLKFVIVDNNIVVDGLGAVHFDILKKKIGWVISVPLYLKIEDNKYVFSKSTIGEYNWTVSGKNDLSIIKVVSENGAPSYFGKCLIATKY